MTGGPAWWPVLALFALLLLAYAGMWRGWRRRGRKHDMEPLVGVPADPAPARLRSAGRYFGTTTAGDWLDRVVAHDLGARSGCRLSLSEEGLDVLRPVGAFRIPADALRGARHDQGIAGKVVPPHGVLVVTWQHGAHLLDTGFRLSLDAPSGGDVVAAMPAPDRSLGAWHTTWVRSISTMVKEAAA